MARISPREKIKVQTLIQRIAAGTFGEVDVDALLITLRPYCGTKRVLKEISDFVAHAEKRDRGLSCESMTSFADSMRYFREHASPGVPINLAEPIRPYLYRLFLSQTALADEEELRTRFRLSKWSLHKKIEKTFSLDKPSKTYCCRLENEGQEFFLALQYVIGCIHAKPAFDISDFHAELYSLLGENAVQYDEDLLRTQSDRITLAVLCLLNGAQISLKDGAAACCELSTEHGYRIVEGQRSLPSGELSDQPARFGTLQILANISISQPPEAVRWGYAVITTNLHPDDYCVPQMTERVTEDNDQGKLVMDVIRFPPTVVMTADFKLAPAG